MNDRGSDPAPASRDLLVLLYGMACPLRCDFCCHPVEDWGGKSMGAEAARDWVRQAGALGMDMLVVSGGEPFVYRDDVLTLIQTATDVGLPSRIVTAVPWAKDEATARATLAPFIDAGLGEISISTDPSHQKFVSRQQAELAARVAVDIGLTCELASVFWERDIAVEDIIDVPLGALTTGGLVAPIGRAKKSGLKPADYRMERAPGTPCGTFDDDSALKIDVTVYPDGRVYPCCAGGFQVEGELTFGSLHEEPLAVILERLRADHWTKLLLTFGIDLLYDAVTFKQPELLPRLPRREDRVSMCELCRDIHVDAALLEQLKPSIQYALEVGSTLEQLAKRARPLRGAA